MLSKILNKKVFYLMLIFFVILDQATKLFVLHSTSISVYHNTGIAFSIAVPQVIIVIIALSIVGGVLTALWKNKLNHTFLIMLYIAGAVGNLIDRFIYGAVIDFIKIGSFPVFNFADSYISIASVLIAYKLLFVKSNNLLNN